MLQDIEDGKIDLIMTKTTSRLNRSNLNAVLLEDLLRQHRATIYTLEDGTLHDLEDYNAEIVRNIDSTFNAKFSKDQSDHGHEVQQRRLASKTLTSKDAAYGYKWIPKPESEIVIDQDAARNFIYIFESYVYRSMTPAEIRTNLEKQGICMTQTTIGHILTDERYIGHFYIGKISSTFASGRAHQKRIKVPRDQWVLVDRPDLRIISDELFDLAQRVRKSRQTTFEGNFPKGSHQAFYTGSHLFSAKIFCAECGRPYQYCHADRAGTIPIYRIHSHGGCESKINRIYEGDLVNITEEAIRETIAGEDNICSVLATTLEECIREAGIRTGDDEQRLQNRKAELNRKAEQLLEFATTNGLTQASKHMITDKINAVTTQIEEIEREICEAKETTNPDIDGKITAVRNAIEELRTCDKIDRKRVLSFVDKIFVHADGNIDIVLRTGVTVNVDGSESVGKISRQGMTALCRPDMPTARGT